MSELNELTPAQQLGKKYGGSQGRQMALKFEFETLLWLSKFKFTNNQVIAKLFDISPGTARDKLRRLATRGVIRKVPCLSVRDNYVYLLTQLGVTQLKELWGVTAKSPWLDVTKIRDRTRASHDLCVQWFCAEQRRQGNTKRITSEFEQGESLELAINLNGNKKHVRHRPDAIIQHWSADDEKESQFYGSWAVEYESVRKGADRMEEIFSYHYKHCNDDRSKYWGVHYLFSRRADLEFYQKILNKVAKRKFPVRYTHQEGGEEYDENQKSRESFLGCFKFHHVHQELVKAFYFERSQETDF